METRKKICLYVLVFFALANGLKWGALFLSNPYQPIDLRTYYLSSKAYFKGMNPYADSSQAAMWQEAPEAERAAWKRNTGFPHAVAVYAPQFVWYFSIYNLFDFTTAKWLQFILNLGALVLLVFCIQQLAGNMPAYLTIACIMAFRGTWYALEAGQPLLQVLSISLFSVYLAEKKDMRVLPAILLAFMSFKFTLLLPFLAYLLCRKHFGIISAYVFAVLILNTLALICSASPGDLITAWQGNISKLWAYTHSFGEMNKLKVISTSISVVLNYYFNIPHTVLQLLNLCLLGAGYGLAIFTGLRKSAGAALLIACLTGLCFGHHLVYDLLGFTCFLLLAKDERIVHNFLFYILALLMMFPIGSAGNWLGSQEINFALPLALLLYWFYTCYYFARRNKVIRNPSWIR